MKKWHFIDYLTGAARLYLRKRVGRASAALAYSLVLSLFPLLICLSGVLAKLELDPAALTHLLQGLLPEGVLITISSFLTDVTDNSTTAMLTGGLILLVTASAMAYRTLSATMEDIHGEPRYPGLAGSIFSFAFSLIFLAVIYLSVVIIVTGRWFITLLTEHFELGGALFDWAWLRFLLLFLVLFLLLSITYRLTVPREKPARHVVTGACVASAALVVVSIVFSSFISLSSRYPLVYGSFASLIVLMIWFYVCGTVLILGAIVNLMIYRAEQGIDPAYDPPRIPRGKLTFREQLFGRKSIRRAKKPPEEPPQEPKA